MLIVSQYFLSSSGIPALPVLPSFPILPRKRENKKEEQQRYEHPYEKNNPGWSLSLIFHVLSSNYLYSILSVSHHTENPVPAQCGLRQASFGFLGAGYERSLFCSASGWRMILKCLSIPTFRPARNQKIDMSSSERVYALSYKDQVPEGNYRDCREL